jgi:hypothetical protein
MIGLRAANKCGDFSVLLVILHERRRNFDRMAGVIAFPLKITTCVDVT